jgi:DNA invertase Pin-like site-specific DNA recombinase
MHVGMMGHGRAPRVQDRRDADVGAEVLRIGGNGEHRLRRGLEQEIAKAVSSARAEIGLEPHGASWTPYKNPGKVQPLIPRKYVTFSASSCRLRMEQARKITVAKAAKRAALYVRVSTDHQTVENQVVELRQVAERRGWHVVEVYKNAGISGAKGRDQRPGLDAMLKDAGRRKFDVVMAWAIDRLGRSLVDLLGTIQHLEACGVDLYLDQQSLDTTTPMGKLLFQVTGAFAEFERTMIRQRVNAGLSTIKAKIRREGRFISNAGIVRSRLGRPGAEPEKIARARFELAKGIGIGKVARLTGLGTGTVHKLKREMAA